MESATPDARQVAPAGRAGGRPRVVIVGAGFGGLSAARALGSTKADVLVLSRTSHHGLWMLLYQVAAPVSRPGFALFVEQVSAVA